MNPDHGLPEPPTPHTDAPTRAPWAAPSWTPWTDVPSADTSTVPRSADTPQGADPQADVLRVGTPRVSAAEQVAHHLAEARAARHERERHIARVATVVSAVWLVLALLRTPLMADLAWFPAFVLAASLVSNTDLRLAQVRMTAAALPFIWVFLTDPAFEDCHRRRHICSLIDAERGPAMARLVPFMVVAMLAAHVLAWWLTRLSGRREARAAHTLDLR